jgi:hypothetical protein
MLHVSVLGNKRSRMTWPAHGWAPRARWRCERDLADLATSLPDRRTRTPARERSANGTRPSVAVFAAPSDESGGRHDYDSS